jgi:hypothetical protein
MENIFLTFLGELIVAGKQGFPLYQPRQTSPFAISVKKLREWVNEISFFSRAKNGFCYQPI